jgi:hypothetical protein
MAMAKRAAIINLYNRRANLFLRKENFLQGSSLGHARTGALFDLRRFRHNGKFCGWPIVEVCSDHENTGEIEKIIERTDIMKLIKIQVVR